MYNFVSIAEIVKQDITDNFQLSVPSSSLGFRSISKDLANEFYFLYHYMGGVSSGKHYGIFLENKLIGAVTRGVVASRFIKLLLFEKNIKLCELSRLCCIPNFKPLSKIVSLFIQECKTKGYDAVLSYADTGQGHKGIIYQATNFCYTGITLPAGHLRWFIDGKEISPRSFFYKYGTAAAGTVIAMNPNIIWKKRTPKHRYVYCISKYSKRHLKINLPYPKN